MRAGSKVHLAVSQLRGNRGHLVQSGATLSLYILLTYNIFVLILYSKLMRNVATVPIFIMIK